MVLKSDFNEVKDKTNQICHFYEYLFVARQPAVRGHEVNTEHLTISS